MEKSTPFAPHVPQCVQAQLMEEISWGNWGTPEDIELINSGEYFERDGKLFGRWGSDTMVFHPEEGFSQNA